MLGPGTWNKKRAVSRRNDPYFLGFWPFSPELGYIPPMLRLDFNKLYKGLKWCEEQFSATSISPILKNVKFISKIGSILGNFRFQPYSVSGGPIAYWGPKVT